MWKRNIEQKYKIEALSKKDINYVLKKYQGKGVASPDRHYLIPSNAKTLREPTSKLYSNYDGPVGHVAFKISEVQNIKVYAARVAILKNVKYAHVVKARPGLKTIDISKKKKTDLNQFDLVNGVDKNQPDMAVFLLKLKKNFQIVETVEHQTPVEPLTQEEKDLLQSYTPDFSDPSPLMRPMSLREAEENMQYMTPDDAAWHMMHNKHAADFHDDIRLADPHMGVRESSFLMIMNKNLSKSLRNNIASYLISKAGVSFVAGPNMNKFLVAMAKKGMISKSVMSDAQEDDITNKIYYNQITDPEELAKFDIKEYGYQLAHNIHTPPEVLKKIQELEVKRRKRPDKWGGGDHKYPDVKWSGMNPSMGGIPGKDYWFYFTDAMSNPNYPIEDLLKKYDEYKKQYPIKRATESMASTLWGRKDLPIDWVWKLVKERGMALPPPEALPQKDFTAYWEKAKLIPKNFKDQWGVFENTAEHPNVTPEVLKDMLKMDMGHDKEKATRIIVKKLQDSGHITKEDTLKRVKKNLKFEGPSELLHHFGAKAWQSKGLEKLKFIEAPDEQRAEIQKEMIHTSSHDEFTFEVLGVYNLSRAIHKDFSKTAKKLGNIKHNVYHGTSIDNAAGILLSGINTKAESRTGQMFGGGFYLATSSSKAAQYASDNFSHSGLGIVFRMDVALGNNVSWKYGRPVSDDPWSRASRELAKERKAYAKKHNIEYDDVANWHLKHDSVHAQKGMALLHDEYVVKEGKQIKINQVILVKKTPKKET
jgi:hypothetical protein